MKQTFTKQQLVGRIGNSALAFRGYNITNLGKTPDLLDVAAYRPILEQVLQTASEICSKAIGESVDLAARARAREPSCLASFPQDVATIVAVEVAHYRLLEELFEIPIKRAKSTIGYSLGELTSLILGGVFELEQILPLPLSMARECAELAENVTMGVLFTRKRLLDMNIVRRLCAHISAEGKGMIAPSTILAPNTTLLLGEGDTIPRFQEKMTGAFPDRVMLRKNQNKWPPLHTPILWRKGLAEQAAIKVHEIGGGFLVPSPPIISCVTGKASYNDYNSREILVRWIDHPQLLWDVIHETLANGTETILHFGPEPNLIPSTYERIGIDVSTQIERNFMGRLGKRVMNSLAQRPWLTSLLTKDAFLLRAPFIEHVIVEDWLLANAPA